MNRLLKLCLAFMLAFSCAACGGSDDGDTTPSSPSSIPSRPVPTPTPDTTDSSFNEDLMWLRQTMIDTPYIAAIGYFGLFDGEYDDLNAYLAYVGVTESYSFLEELSLDEYIELEGEQLYCVVPRDEDASVYVYEWIIDESNDYMGEPGNLLYESFEGHPILVRGNVSEYMPNMMIEVIGSDGTSLAYVPGLSGMDGTLLTPEEQPWVIDITPYEFFENVYGYDYGFDEATLYLYEAWNASVLTMDGDFINASFTFYEDSTVEFCYGPEGEPYQYYYEGHFFETTDEEYPENTYHVELYLIDDYSDEQNGEDIYCALTFATYPDLEGLMISFAYGDPFGYGDYEAEYYFGPSVG